MQTWLCQYREQMRSVGLGVVDSHPFWEANGVMELRPKPPPTMPVSLPSPQQRDRMFMGLGTICPGEIPELNLVNIVTVFHASVPSEWPWSTHKHFQSPAKGKMSWGFAHCSFSRRCVRARNHLQVKLLPAALSGTPPPHAVPTHLCGSVTGQDCRSSRGIEPRC